MSLISVLKSRFKIAFTTEIIGVVSGAILTVLLARLLDPNTYGLFFLALAIFAVADNLGTLGIQRAAARYISEYKEVNKTQVRHIVKFAFRFNLLIIGITSFGLLIGNDVIALLIGEPELSPYLLLGSIYIIFSILAAFVRLILQGFENIKAASVLRALNKFCRLLLAVGFVMLGLGGIGALTGYIISYTLVVLIGLIYIFYKHYQPLPKAAIEEGIRKRLLRYSAPIAVTQTSHFIDEHIDKIILGFFTGPLGVAYYTIGKQIAQFIQTPMTALAFTLSPMYGAQKAQKNIETVSRIYESTLAKGLMLYIPAATGMILTAEPGIIIIFGSEYAAAAPIVQVLALFAILVSITKLTGEGLDYMGRARERAISRAFTAFLNVGLNIILIPRLGVIGAAIATVITFSIHTTVCLYIMFLELNIRTLWLTKQIVYVLFISGLMGIIVWSLSKNITGIITLSITVLIGVFVWGILAILFGLLDLNRLYHSEEA